MTGHGSYWPAATQKVCKLVAMLMVKISSLLVHAVLVTRLVLESKPHVFETDLVPAGELVLGLVSLILLVLQFPDYAGFLMTSLIHSQAGLAKL